MEAWQKRAVERQELLQKLKRDVYNIEDVMDLPAEVVSENLALCLLALHRISCGREKISLPQGWPLSLYKCIIKPINEFSRTTEERNALLCEMAEFFLNQIASSFRAALQHQETFEPERIFGAPTMAEVG